MSKQWLLGLFLVIPSFARADILLSWEAPGVQSSQRYGVVTEGFDTLASTSYLTYSSAFGSWTGSPLEFEIRTADPFGGAGGSGKYIAIHGASSGFNEVDLTLKAPSSYLGTWLSAIDLGNSIEFYRGTVLLKRFDTLTNNFVRSGPWSGNPNPPFKGQDGGEAFAYLNFTATAGTTFDEVRFIQIGGNLEMDNVSVLLPEPAGALLLCLAGCLLAMGRTIRCQPHCS